MCRKMKGKFISFLLVLNRLLEFILQDFKKDGEASEENHQCKEDLAEGSENSESKISQRNTGDGCSINTGCNVSEN